ncbi:MAG: DUF4416 family protein [Synergistaceae bacterium]|nr:DUF4416 family protein [Synergistaceae bacterium]
MGLLFPKGERGLEAWVEGRLGEIFGPIERRSGEFAFDYTDYYKNISPELTRCFFSFSGLRGAQGLADWKRDAICLEAESALGESGRRVNIDPGYLDGAKLALASTKDNAHRIYLRDGIFAETTMCRRKNGWERFSFTFPDFRSGVYDAFLDLVRLDWRRDLRNIRKENGAKGGENDR